MYFLLTTLSAVRYITAIMWERTYCFRFALHFFFRTHVTVFAAVSRDDHLAGIHFLAALAQLQHPVPEI